MDYVFPTELLFSVPDKTRKERCSGAKDNIKEASAGLDNKVIEEKKKRIRLGGVYSLEFNIKITKTNSPLQINNLLPNKQMKICENYVDKCLVVKHKEGSVFGKGYSEPFYCKVKRDLQKEESLIDLILHTKTSPR